MKDDRLPKIVLIGQPSRAKRKADSPRLGWEDIIKKDLKEMETYWEGVTREALNRLVWGRIVRSCVGLRRLGDLLVVVVVVAVSLFDICSLKFVKILNSLLSLLKTK
jgi:hypothetical protein